MDNVLAFICIVTVLGIGLWWYLREKKKEEEKKRIREEDKNWTENEIKRDEPNLGSYDAIALALDKDESRYVFFVFYEKAALVKIYEAYLRKVMSFKYDEIIDCSTYTKTIVGESHTTAETTTDWGRVNYDPNATITQFKTTKEPDKIIHYINITTSNMSSPLLTYWGDHDIICRLEALIKIVIKRHQS